MPKNDTRLVSFDYLRTFLIILVVIYHSLLAYTPFFEISPLTDSKQWLIFNFVILFEDSFFMALLFFVSGFFLWPSLKRKGIKIFLRDRLARLGIPFLLITFLAYIFAVPQVAGHLWFLWVLLEYNFFVAIIYKFLTPLSKLIAQPKINILNKPLLLCGALIIISFLAYLPMALKFGFPERIFFYLIYFLFGVWLGTQGIEKTIFKLNGNLTKYWLAWLTIGLLSFVLRAWTGLLINNQNIINIFIYSISSATISFGLIGFFIKFVKKNTKIIDQLNNTAYGIYIVHYPFVLWLQYLLLNSDLQAIYKALLVLTLSLILSYVTINLLHRIPKIKKII